MTAHVDASTELLARRAARRSLLAFARYTHPNWTEGEHHRRICELLERVAKGEVRRAMIFAPPRHTKSELASRRFPAWYLGHNPTAQLITATYAADFATDFGADVRQIVSSPEYGRLFPGVGLSPDRTAMGNWRTSKGGIYVATGVGGPITGRGMDLGIIDDPFKNRDDADSAKRRESVWRWFNSTFLTRMMPGAAMCLMCTRWAEDDLAGRLLKQGGWDVLELPAIAHEGTDHEQALWPEWFPLEELRDRRSRMPGREWSALYQQRPRPESGDYCKREWFEPRYVAKPERLRVYIASDYAVTEPESSEGRGPDYTEHGVFGVAEDGHVYVIDWWSGRTTADEWVDSLLTLVDKHKPACVFGEAGVIRRAVEPILARRASERRIFPYIEWVASTGDKAARARAFQGRASMGNWHFPVGPWADRVIDQCVGFPAADFDDAFDACSLFGRVVDQAAGAAKAAPKPKDFDPWHRAMTKTATTTSWKIA